LLYSDDRYVGLLWAATSAAIQPLTLPRWLIARADQGTLLTTFALTLEPSILPRLQANKSVEDEKKEKLGADAAQTSEADSKATKAADEAGPSVSSASAAERIIDEIAAGIADNSLLSVQSSPPTPAERPPYALPFATPETPAPQLPQTPETPFQALQPPASAALQESTPARENANEQVVSASTEQQQQQIQPATPATPADQIQGTPAQPPGAEIPEATPAANDLAMSEIDPAFLEALPEDIRAEVRGVQIYLVQHVVVVVVVLKYFVFGRCWLNTQLSGWQWEHAPSHNPWYCPLLMRLAPSSLLLFLLTFRLISLLYFVFIG
jgi:hypothetical protein